MSLRIEINGGYDAFEPGDSLEGTVYWELSQSPESMALALVYKTYGKGDSDVLVASKQDLAVGNLAVGNQSSGQVNFQVPVPLGPYSFDGTLISGKWTIEAQSTKPRESVELPITIAPGGQALKLEKIGETAKQIFAGPGSHKRG